MTGVRAPCGLWQSEHLTLPSMIGWCEGLRVALRTCLWQVPQVSASIGRAVVVYGATCSALSPWMLWQLLQVTSLRECLPDSQNASWRLPEWQVMHTAVFSAGVPLLILFS